MSHEHCHLRGHLSIRVPGQKLILKAAQRFVREHCVTEVFLEPVYHRDFNARDFKPRRETFNQVNLLTVAILPIFSQKIVQLPFTMHDNKTKI